MRQVTLLVGKDLRILRRSPLITALIIIYPILLAVLIGLALSRGPDKPAVAIFNQIPKGASTFKLGGERIDAQRYARELRKAVDPIPVNSRKEAIDKVRSGEALAALVVPFDLPERLGSQLKRPTLEVYVNREDPLKANVVDDVVNAQVARANLAISRAFTKTAARYANLILDGGRVNFFGERLDILGLKPSEQIMRAAAKELPKGSKERRNLERAVRFAHFSAANFDFSDEALEAISQPIAVDTHAVSGRTPSLTTFATALALAISMMFVTVILAAAGLALEREEGVYHRLLRSGISPIRLLVAKVGFASLCSLFLSTLVVAVLELFVSFEWSRFGYWIPAFIAASVGFAALGTTLGAATRETRSATLAAVMLSLPIAFLALVPSGALEVGLYRIVQAISALFPFKASVDAFDRALYGAGPSLVTSVAHLTALAISYLFLARLALRRFSA